MRVGGETVGKLLPAKTEQKEVKDSKMRTTIKIQFMSAMLVAVATVVMADEPQPAGLPISFTVEKPGHVSAAVYDAEGRLVRELLHAVPMSAGKQSLIWDGLDRDGQALPAGEYT